VSLNKENRYVDVEVWHIHKKLYWKNPDECAMNEKCVMNHVIKEKSLWVLNGWWES